MTIYHVNFSKNWIINNVKTDTNIKITLRNMFVLEILDTQLIQKRQNSTETEVQLYIHVYAINTEKAHEYLLNQPYFTTTYVNTYNIHILDTQTHSYNPLVWYIKLK